MMGTSIVRLNVMMTAVILDDDDTTDIHERFIENLSRPADLSLCPLDVASLVLGTV